MIDPSKIGQDFPPFSFEIERGKIREMALAIGDTNPIYHSKAAAQAAGYPDVPIFPTSPTTFSLWSDSQNGKYLAEAGLKMERFIHGEEHFEYLAPLYAGDTVTGISKLLDAKTRTGSNGSKMDIITLETRYTNQHGQAVLTVRHVLIGI